MATLTIITIISPTGMKVGYKMCRLGYIQRNPAGKHYKNPPFFSEMLINGTIFHGSGGCNSLRKDSN